MSGALPPQSIAAFERDGALFPVPVLERREADALLHRLEAVERQRAGRIPPPQNVKIHLLLPWLWDLVHDIRILDPVESLLGPDILCWASNFFVKEAGDRKHVPWHQDTTYWGLSDTKALTAWIAFTDSKVANGCLQIVKGTHHAPLPHVETGDETSMLPIRERLAIQVDPATVANVELSAGEMSLHDGRLAHGSAANADGPRRVGLAIRYIPATSSPVDGAAATATLVRGRNRGRFELEQRPAGEFDAAALERYRTVLRSWMAGVSAAVEAYRISSKA